MNIDDSAGELNPHRFAVAVALALAVGAEDGDGQAAAVLLVHIAEDIREASCCLDLPAGRGFARGDDDELGCCGGAN